MEPGIFKLAEASSPTWLPALLVDEATGAVLKPGDPEHCEGNGKRLNVDGDPIECCCDECDYLQLCFPEE